MTWIDFWRSRSQPRVVVSREISGGFDTPGKWSDPRSCKSRVKTKTMTVLDLALASVPVSSQIIRNPIQAIQPLSRGTLGSTGTY